MTLIRSMIDRVVLTPKSPGPGLDIELHGALANILAVCSEANMTKPSGVPEGCQLSLVAGAGCTYTEQRAGLLNLDMAITVFSAWTAAIIAADQESKMTKRASGHPAAATNLGAFMWVTGVSAAPRLRSARRASPTARR